MRVGVIVKIRQDGGELLDVVAYDGNVNVGSNPVPMELLIPVELPDGQKIVVNVQVIG